MRFITWVPAAAALIAISAVPAEAGVLVFSNLAQPGNLYGPDGAGFGANPFLPGAGPALLATRFTVAAAAQLEAFYAPLDIIHGPADLTAYLMTEANGLPDSVLESIHFGNAGGFPVPLTAIHSGLHPTLLPGVPYWFAVSAGTDTFANWLLTPFQGNPLGSSNFAAGTLVGGVTVNWEIGAGGSTGREGALQVEGLFVPEPSTLLLAGIGLMVLLRRAGAGWEQLCLRKVYTGWRRRQARSSRNHQRFDGIPALENVSFTAGPGEMTGYLGSNGSDKSTTVKIVTGLGTTRRRSPSCGLHLTHSGAAVEGTARSTAHAHVYSGAMADSSSETYHCQAPK